MYSWLGNVFVKLVVWCAGIRFRHRAPGSNTKFITVVSVVGLVARFFCEREMISLQSAALDSFYEDILHSLSLCREHYSFFYHEEIDLSKSSFIHAIRALQPPESEYESGDSMDSEFGRFKNLLEHVQVSLFFRARLALCSRKVGGKVRRELLKKFLAQLDNGTPERRMKLQKAAEKLQWSFLNIVLDESVKDLNCYLSGRTYLSMAESMRVIAKHSPFLEKLTFRFRREFFVSFEFGREGSYWRSAYCKIFEQSHTFAAGECNSNFSKEFLLYWGLLSQSCGPQFGY